LRSESSGRVLRVISAVVAVSAVFFEHDTPTKPIMSNKREILVISMKV
jgi:hypothetical protein